MNKIKILHPCASIRDRKFQSHKIMHVYENICLILYISALRCLDTKKTKDSELRGSRYSNIFTQTVSLKMYFNVWLPPLHM